MITKCSFVARIMDRRGSLRRDGDSIGVRVRTAPVVRSMGKIPVFLVGGARAGLFGFKAIKWTRLGADFWSRGCGLSPSKRLLPSFVGVRGLMIAWGGVVIPSAPGRWVSILSDVTVWESHRGQVPLSSRGRGRTNWWVRIVSVRRVICSSWVRWWSVVLFRGMRGVSVWWPVVVVLSWGVSTRHPNVVCKSSMISVANWNHIIYRLYANNTNITQKHIYAIRDCAMF